MPNLCYWFDEPLIIDWDTDDEGPGNNVKGPLYYTYPLTWLVPYVDVNLEEISKAPRPIWITDIHPDSPVGKIDLERPGSFICELPSTFGLYIDSLPYDYRKRARAILRKNNDVIVEAGSQLDIDDLWSNYTHRISYLNMQIGGKAYSERDMAIRRKFFRGSHIKLLRMSLDGVLVAVNVSLWRGGVVYDLACLIKEDDTLKKRSLGSFAILKNIELSIGASMESYDLLAGEYGGKERFGATEHKLKTYIACSRSFAARYEIADYLVSEWVEES